MDNTNDRVSTLISVFDGIPTDELHRAAELYQSLVVNRRGTKNPNASLVDCDPEKVRDWWRSGNYATKKEFSEHIGIPFGVVKRILRGESY